MAKSGPKELAEYHRQVLEREGRRGKVSKATEFDPETMDEATQRVNAVLHPADNKPAEAPAPAPAPTRKRRQRSDTGTHRAKPTPGTMSLKIECSIAEGTDLLAYFIRTYRPDLAHQVVDALAKAQKEQQA